MIFFIFIEVMLGLFLLVMVWKIGFSGLYMVLVDLVMVLVLERLEVMVFMCIDCVCSVELVILKIGRLFMVYCFVIVVSMECILFLMKLSEVWYLSVVWL